MGSDGSSKLFKIGHKFKGSMPYILNELVFKSLNYNNKNPRNFPGGLRCVSIAMNGNKLVAFGKNTPKTHTFTKIYHDQHKMSIHAEADMTMKILKCNNNQKITDIIIIRGTEKPLNSYPCSICKGLLNMYFDKVRMWWFNADLNKWEVELI